MAGPANLKIAILGDAKSAVGAAKETQSAFGGLGSTLKTMAQAAFLGAVVVGAKKAVNAASDLNESLSKSNQVFGSSAKAIESWSNTAARSMGLSKQQALENASSFGNMFRQLNMGAGDAAKMSQKMVGLAADFASFHNADITQVLQAQQAAFRGEYDALQRFVPTINAAAVQTKALAMTGKENAAQLTEQEKATATYKLMLEGAGQAQGDFARTSGGYANQQRILNATLEDLAASLGQLLLPAFVTITGVVVKFLDVLLMLPKPLQGVVVALAAGGAAWLLWGEQIKKVGSALIDFGKKTWEALAGMSPLALAVVAVGAALIALAVYLNSQPSAWDRAKAAAAGWIETTKSAASASGDALKYLKQQQTDLIASAKETAKTHDAMSQKMLDLKAKAEVLGQAIGEQEQSNKVAAAAERERVKSLADVAAGTIAATAATDDAKRSMLEYQNQLLAVQGGEIGYKSALLAVESAQRNLDQANKDYLPGSLEVRQAQLDLENANLGVSSAAIRLADDTAKLAQQNENSLPGLIAMRQKLIDVTYARDGNTNAVRGEIDVINGYIAKLGTVPPEVPTVVTAETDAAMAKIRELSEAADATARARTIIFKAEKGEGWAGGWGSSIPNAGPNMAALSSLPRVTRTSAGALRAIPSAGTQHAPTAQAVPITVNVTTTGLGADSAEIQRDVVRAIRGYVDRNGPIERITP